MLKSPLQPHNPITLKSAIEHETLNTDINALYWLNYVCAFFTTILAFTFMFGLNKVTLVLLAITATIGLASYWLVRKTSRTFPRFAKASALVTSSIIVLKFVSLLYVSPIDKITTHYLELATVGFLIPLILFHSYVAFGNRTGQRLMIGIYIFILVASLPFLSGFSQYTDNFFIRSFLLFNLCVTTAFILIYVGAFNILRKERFEKNIALLEFNSKDKLTNLANRTTFTKYLEEHYTNLVEMQQYESSRLILIDINNFKRTNDTHGQIVGDNCLKLIAKRIQNAIPDNTFLARTDGDEFTLCLLKDSSLDLESYCQQLSKILAEPFDLGIYTLNLRFTVAGCLFPTKNESHNILLKQLAWAMHTAKQKGLPYCIYSDELNEHLLYKEHLENELASAVHSGEFKLYYQPLLNLQTGEVDSAEALIRWHNKSLGQVSPAEFIPIAETSGLILSIGHWVIEAACMQLKRWEDVGYNFSVAINISMSQFSQENFVQDIQNSLANHQISPEKLQLEITESQVVDNVALHQLIELQKLGCIIKLDDFGTGYSCLSVIGSLPLNQLKIDRSFIQNLDNQFDGQAWNTVKTIISLAHNFNLKVVAEGIETFEQLEHLQELGCDYAQGFYIAKPIPPKNFYDEFLINPNQLNYSSSNNQLNNQALS